MSSTKSQTGHLLGAAGAVEAIYSICSINKGVVPFNKNLDNPCINDNIDLIRNEARETKPENVISNSFGFGGTNASIVMGKCEA